MTGRILVLGTADWSQPIATNQHYVVRELAREFDVTYTESMGLRTPEFKMRDLRRIARRVGLGRSNGSGVERVVPERVEVRSPKVLPRHTGIAARLNRPRLHDLVMDWISQPEPRVLWTYTPVTYGLDEIATSVVYHCVDLLGAVEGIPSDLIDREERRLSRRTTAALGTSPVVVEHLQSQGFSPVEFWPNVADTAVIANARPTALNRAPRRAVFAGNLSTTKVDFPLLHRLVANGVDLHLAGPIAEGGGSADRDVAALSAAGATYHGMLAPEALAELYWSAEMGLIPYVLNEYTRGVSPLKTYEYLAAGLSVISTAVPSVEAVPGAVTVARDSDAFVDAVIANDDVQGSPTVDRIALAEQFSWAGRGATARTLARRLTS